MVLFKTNFIRLIQYLLRSAKTPCAKTAERQNGQCQNAGAKPVAPNRRRQNVTYPSFHPSIYQAASACSIEYKTVVFGTVAVVHTIILPALQTLSSILVVHLFQSRNLPSHHHHRSRETSTAS